MPRSIWGLRQIAKALRLAIPKERREKAVVALCRALQLDVEEVALHHVGILNFASPEASGEGFFISTVLPRLFGSRPITCFDIGANHGEYTRLLLGTFADATVFAFEPNQRLCSLLSASFADRSVRAVNVAVGETDAMIPMFFPLDETYSEFSSHYRQAVEELRDLGESERRDVECVTVDSFCRANGLDSLDLLKIDVEGMEMSVIKGATDMVASARAKVIHFEFNEMNVVSRVFLRDFVQALPTYRLFRLLPEGLLPLSPYSPRNEVFLFQNVVAFAEPLVPDVLPFVREDG